MNRNSLRQLQRLVIGFWLFQKSLKPEEPTSTVEQLDEEEADFGRIRCPLCRWQPDATSHWECGDCWEPEFFLSGCGTEWNTFATHGVCPGCGHQWRWTICLSCDEWSLHEDWYVSGQE